MQRKGKSHKAAMGPDAGRITMFEIIEFLETAQHCLERNDDEDSAFYFEQIVTHLRENPDKGFKENVSRVLGL